MLMIFLPVSVHTYCTFSCLLCQLAAFWFDIKRTAAGPMDSVSHAHAGVKGERRKTHAAGSRVGMRGLKEGPEKMSTHTPTL